MVSRAGAQPALQQLLVTVNSSDLMATQPRWRHDIPIVMMRDALLCGPRRERSRLGGSGCPDRGCLRYDNLLGPAGLVLLGLFVLFICTAMNLYEDVPS
jgi:hypothetical protein